MRFHSKIQSYTLGIIFILLLLIIYLKNPANQLYILFAIAASLTITSLRTMIYSKFEKNKWSYIVASMEILPLLLISYVDHTNISQGLFFILVADLIIKYPYHFTLPYSFVTFVMYVGMEIEKQSYTSSMDILYFIINSVLVYSIILSFVYLAKSQIMNAAALKKLMQELEMKNKELEEMILVEERNRIAGEIHDTVGHTLTVALIELEASKMLKDKDPNLSLEKLDTARKQVKKGLADLRTSINMLKDGHHPLGFISSIELFVHNTMKHCFVEIEYIIQIETPLLPIQERVLYNAIQEGFTNGLKHANSKRFTLLIKEKGQVIQLALTNFGAVPAMIHMGFGLNNMKERVEGLGGNFHVTVAPGENFSIHIELPIG
ncbi:sensor histidine kinase [Chengkuizengella sp. SCS-71B]|uniref:sensor histidine kinase n=1 Tax=Chengkuizengella sp. SCS-71B TaxID=3115290 RepID=UPI0032C23FDF